MRADDTPLLSAEGLGFSYPGAALLSGLGFQVRPGLTLVRGGDGRGKSTLLCLMAGELAPTAGRLQRSAGSVFLAHPADPALDARVAADWLASQQAQHPAWQAGHVAPLAEALGLSDHLHKPFYMLSTGSRRKVGLVAAAVSGAALTLVDGPYAALDARSCRVVTELLAEAAERRERAWVVADYEAPAGVAVDTVIELGD